MAKRLLLIDPMDRASFVEASRAMALGRIDYVEYKPGPPPNGKKQTSTWWSPGGGTAGLAAAVYGASEGPSTLIL